MSYGRQPRHVVVVGSGISGLTAAYLVGQAGRGAVRVTVVEKGPVVGGHLKVAEVAGLPIDEGAESLLNRRPEAVELARTAGLGHDLEHPVTAAGLWSRGVVVPLPATTLLGVPSVPADLAQILDPDDVARVAAEPTVPGSPLLDDDVAVGTVVSARMGQAVTQRLVDPFLGGVYAGRADELSLRATMPDLAAALSREGSLLRAAASVRGGAAGSAVPVFAGIRGGVGRLPAAVAAVSGAEIRTGTTVRKVIRASGQRAAAAAAGAVGAVWRVEIGPAPTPEFLDADAVIVAVPATPAARMLADVAPAAAAELAAVEYASVAIVTMAMPVNAFPERPSWSGYLVPPIDGHVTTAVTFSSVKWGWLGKAADDLVVLRASIGRHRDQANLQHEDGELVDTVLAELGQAVGVAGKPVDARVSRWGGALPQYAVGHVERVARVRAAVEANPGLAVCGAVYDGVGVAACVASARRAVDHVLPSLGLVPGSRA
ncbi:MAG TPA: protoporphyrinogen oxidase [Jiangellaceae bacterium]|nr:protoporphyrinogen oxidase [Jiangellaceae bacterium]